MRYQTLVREICRNYKANKKELNRGETAVYLSCNKFKNSKNNSIARPVESAILNCMDARTERLRKEVDAFEWSINTLENIAKSKKENAKTKENAQNALKIAELLYIQSKSANKAALELCCSVETLYRNLRPFHRLMGGKLGLCKNR